MALEYLKKTRKPQPQLPEHTIPVGMEKIQQQLETLNENFTKNRQVLREIYAKTSEATGAEKKSLQPTINVLFEQTEGQYAQIIVLLTEIRGFWDKIATNALLEHQVLTKLNHALPEKPAEKMWG